MSSRHIFVLLFSFLLSSCNINLAKIEKEKAALNEGHPQDLWMQLPPNLWLRDKASSGEIPLEKSTSLNRKHVEIGKCKAIPGKFRKCILDDAITMDRPKVWVDVTDDCMGLIESDYALDTGQWSQKRLREAYYRNVNDLIEKTSSKMLSDLNSPFDDAEKLIFVEALKSLVWKESSWQHYLKTEDHTFILISASTYNKLGDWGITQVAKSSLKKEQLLNGAFFAHKGYCSIYSTLYYGFSEYYYAYLHSRDLKCNQTKRQKVLGAYNRYVSGFSSCNDGYSKSSKEFAGFQRSAVEEFGNVLSDKPWERHM